MAAYSKHAVRLRPERSAAETLANHVNLLLDNPGPGKPRRLDLAALERSRLPISMLLASATYLTFETIGRLSVRELAEAIAEVFEPGAIAFAEAPRKERPMGNETMTIDGYALDEERTQFHREALAYAEAHCVDYVTAALALERQQSAPASAPSGYATDPEREALHRSAVAYAEAHGVDYIDAVIAVEHDA